MSSDATPVLMAQKRAPPELKAVADFLRGKNGPKVRRGVLNGKRVDYFKGKTAIRTLLGPAYQKLKKVPAVKDEEEAKALLAKLLPHAFYLSITRPDPPTPQPASQPRPLLLSPTQSFAPDTYYAWFYEGSPLSTILGGLAMLLVIFAGVLFPLWPVQLRIGVWYLSVAALGCVGALIALAIVRLIIYIFTVVSMKRAIWIFPNLFEDVGFFESFVPTWAYEETKKKKKKASSSSSSAGTSKPKKAGRHALPTQPMAPGAGGQIEQVAPAPEDTVDTSSAVPAGAASTATGFQVNGETAGQGLRERRQAASVEEVEDDEV